MIIDDINLYVKESGKTYQVSLSVLDGPLIVWEFNLNEVTKENALIQVLKEAIVLADDNLRVLSKLTLENLTELIKEFWDDSLNYNNPPYIKNQYIDIQEGWFGKGDDKYWGFSATLPNGSKSCIMTGLGGFLEFWNKDMPVKYNGVMLPVEEYDKFYNYCKNDLSHEEEE